ncbi:MAG: hypothetical protein FGM33_05345 [Candidatus Kapabacteria bacterium]|nr:hypothetical protein [Candidatus Kapabacteria bacterium]
MQRRQLHGLDTLLKMTSKYRHPNVTALHYRDGKLFALGVDDVMVSADSGKTWKPLGEELKQSTVIDIATSGDSVITLSPSGAMSVSTNRGLSWSRLSASAGKSVNTIKRDSSGWSSVMVQNRELTCSAFSEQISINDSLIIAERPAGCRIVYSSAAFKGASCIAASYRHVFIGMGRQGILTFDRESGQVTKSEFDVLNGEYVRSLCVSQDMLYAAISTGSAGVYRRPEYGNNWSIIPIDQPMSELEVLCMHATQDGVFFGMRESGLAFIPHASKNAIAIHLGLRDAMVNGVQNFGDGILISTQLRGPLMVDVGSLALTELISPDVSCFAPSACAVGSVLLTACQNGAVMFSSDSGRSWTVRSTPSQAGAIVLIKSFGPDLMLLTTAGVLTSRDTGRTWQRIHDDLRQLETSNMFRMDSVDIVMTNLGAYRAVVSGSAQKLDVKTKFDQEPFVNAISSDGKTIYASGFPAVIVSIDDGITWHAYNSPELMATRCLTVAGDLLFVASADGFIYRVLRSDLHQSVLGSH